MSRSTTRPSPTESTAAYWVCGILLVAFFAWCWLNVIPLGDEVQQFPRALHTLYPGWLDNDLFVGAPQGDHWFFFRFLAGLFWLTGLTIGPILARIAIWVLMAYALLSLARALQLKPLAVLIGTALFVAYDQSRFGGETILGEAIAKHLAYPVVLFALSAWLNNRFLWSAALLGLSMTLHALVGMWATVAIVGLMLFDGQLPSRLWTRLGMVISWLLFALPGLLTISPLVLQNVQSDSADADRIFIYFRHPHHLNPSVWPLSDYVHFFLVFLACILLVSLLPSSIRATRIKRFIWFINLLAAASIMVGILLRPTFFLKLHPFRFAPPLTALLTAFFLGQVLAASRLRSIRWAGAFAAAGLALWLAPRGAYRLYESRMHPTALESARLDALHWLRDFAPANASVLANPAWTDVQWETRRTGIASYKLIPFSAPRINDWYQNLTCVVGGPPWSLSGDVATRWIRRAYESESTGELLRAASTLAADFAVVPGPCRQLPNLAYSNEHNCIYQTGRPPQPDQRYLIIRYDDYAPFSPYQRPPRNIETEKRLIDLAEKYRAKITVGVIPFPVTDGDSPPLDPGATTAAQSWLGDADNDWLKLLQYGIEQKVVEPALHGFEHRRRTLAPHRPGEYRAQNPQWQLESIRAGKTALDSALQQKIATFVPPWNAWDAKTVHALEALDFRWLSPDQHHAESVPAKLKVAPQGTADPLAALAAMQEDSPPGTVLVLVTHPFDFEAQGAGESYFQNVESVLAFADSSPKWSSVGFADLPDDPPSQWATRFEAAVAWSHDRERLADLRLASPSENAILLRPLPWYQDHAWRLRLPFVAVLTIAAFLAAIIVNVAASMVAHRSTVLAQLATGLGLAASVIITIYLVFGAWRIVEHDYSVRGLRWLAIAMTTGVTLAFVRRILRSRRTQSRPMSSATKPIHHDPANRATVTV